MRRRFTRVKWLARETRKDLGSGQDFGEGRVVVEGVFVPGAVGFWRNLGKTRITSQQGTT
ncbi:MAG TPA: hypothetical protein VJN89_18495 [Candidatus Acidoferrum sp.]|nr:hypothetical protein [Candidatus Acidoferrum sp.]